MKKTFKDFLTETQLEKYEKVIRPFPSFHYEDEEYQMIADAVQDWDVNDQREDWENIFFFAPLVNKLSGTVYRGEWELSEKAKALYSKRSELLSLLDDCHEDNKAKLKARIKDIDSQIEVLEEDLCDWPRPKKVLPCDGETALFRYIGGGHWPYEYWKWLDELEEEEINNE